MNTHLNKTFSVFLLINLSTLFGCGSNSAINRTEDLSNAWPNISLQSDRTILVNAIDERPYVLNKKKGASFIGLMRGGFGTPFDMNTTSGQPLAEDLKNAITSGMKNEGLIADSYSIGESQELDNNLRVVVLHIKEWKSDTYTTSKFLFDLKLEVLDSTGKVLASNSNRNISVSGETIEKKATASPLESGRLALTSLFKNKQILDALR